MLSHRTVHLNGLDISLTEQGEGPLAVLIHGFPETAYSWRHQLPALAEAGYRAVALDQRGYGASDRPDPIDQYSIFHLVGDIVALIHELGEQQAVVIGHDWGAVVAWHTALLRPDVVRGVVGISVPPWPRGPIPPTQVNEQRFGKDFYQNHFQEPGVADAELGNDVEATLRGLYADVLPEADLKIFVDQFTTSTFTGGLNYYRNLDRNWQQLAPWQDAPITPPALYISGEDDPVRAMYPFDDTVRALLPNLHDVVDIPHCGHWTQQQHPDQVNAAILQFLKGL